MIGIERVLDKLGSGGVVIAALGCTACFPALGAPGLGRLVLPS